MKIPKLFNSLILIVGIIFIILLSANSCKECDKSTTCDLEPNAGPCKANFPKYYYDKKEKNCKEFSYGGCDGMVPFETLEDCQKQCECMK